MNELNKISNKALLEELEKRMDKGEIKLQGKHLLTQGESGNYYFELRMDAEQALWMIKRCLVELEEEAYCLRNEARDLKKDLESRK